MASCALGNNKSLKAKNTIFMYSKQKSKSGSVGWRLIFKFLHCQQTIANNPLFFFWHSDISSATYPPQQFPSTPSLPFVLERLHCVAPGSSLNTPQKKRSLPFPQIFSNCQLEHFKVNQHLHPFTSIVEPLTVRINWIHNKPYICTYIMPYAQNKD